ncbi:MAG: inositol monophosphatase family protein [Pseudanabaenaceae cyanobacterium bins.68]|nr:inositol monophosphatase family protein [Pseudanabaenaceae cyanobacterium bins.68]
MNPNLIDLMAIARHAAIEAAQILLRHYHSTTDLQIRDKGELEGQVTIADLEANQAILANLQQDLGDQDFAYLTEETEDDLARLHHDWVWMIDPLDGTSDFIKHTGEFAVHIGLVYRQRPILGVVALPAAGVIYRAIQGEGAYRESMTNPSSSQILRVADKTELSQLVAIASRSHRTPALEYILANLPTLDQLSVGSIGGKLTAIAEGRADFYLSLSGKSAPKDWDYCAPEIILTEAGGKLTHFDQTPLIYNQADISQWGSIIASNGYAHGQLCDYATHLLQKYPKKVN